MNGQEVDTDCGGPCPCGAFCNRTNADLLIPAYINSRVQCCHFWACFVQHKHPCVQWCIFCNFPVPLANTSGAIANVTDHGVNVTSFEIYAAYVPDNHPNVVCNASAMQTIKVDTVPPTAVFDSTATTNVVQFAFSEMVSDMNIEVIQCSTQCTRFTGIIRCIQADRQRLL